MILLAQQVVNGTEMDGRYVLWGLIAGFACVGIYKLLEALASAIEGSDEVDSDDRHG